ncbi:MAG: diguanylate cyclase [Acidiferrobacterales bacterium]
MRVLVVDDDMAIRTMVGEILMEEDYDVTLAASAEEALRAFRMGGYGLVITDIRMGGMSGVELLKEIKQIDSIAHVIVMTSYASIDSAVAVIKAGAYDYLIKPFEDLELVLSAANRAMQSVHLMREKEVLMQSLKQKNLELELANKRLQEIAVRDGLTGLFNHRYFQEILSKELARSARHNRDLSLLFLDVDDFKKYNDTHGHQLGDTLLKQLSHIIKDAMREGDVVARYGGEEFVVVLPETDNACAVQVAEKLRKLVEGFAFRGEETQPQGKVTISLGVSNRISDSTTASLIQRADQALYKAKSEGKNCIRTAS